MTTDIHVPVLPKEVLTYLSPQKGEVFLDGTVGMGGHSALIAERIGSEGTLIGVDQDPAALKIAGENLSFFKGKLILRLGNFRRLAEFLREEGILAVDGILFDLGVSSLQFDQGERGFSYRQDAPLDMRMDPTSGRSAAELINEAGEDELAYIIREYSEERWAARIAKFIVKERSKKPILTTGQLVEIIKAAVPAGARRTGPHPARRTFQALRIAVNQELEALEEGLSAGVDYLAKGGRMVVISFHSLEDRIVKRVFRERSRSCRCNPEDPVCRCGGDRKEVEILTLRPVTPSAEEIERNPRSRSAKLRAILKVV